MKWQSTLDLETLTDEQRAQLATAIGKAVEIGLLDNAAWLAGIGGEALVGDERKAVGGSCLMHTTYDLSAFGPESDEWCLRSAAYEAIATAATYALEALGLEVVDG